MLGEKVGVWPGKIPSRSAAAAGHASWRRSSAPPDAAGVTRSLAAFVFLALTASAALADSSTDARFLAALRQRSLFELAEAYCRQELVRPGVPEIRQAELVIELSATLAEAAASSAPENRVSLWQRAEQVADDFVRQHPENPRVLQVRLQRSLVVLAQGELARQESQVAATPEPLVEQSRTALREAIRQLDQLSEDVETELRTLSRPGSSPRDGRLSELELLWFSRHIQYQHARAYQNQAQCYPAESPDRANALARAVDRLDPLARLDATDPLVWSARLDEAICHRLLGDYRAARERLDALVAAGPPTHVLLRAGAERIRLALAENRVADAVAFLSAGRQREGAVSGDLDYAWLETMLAAWRASSDAGDQAKAAEWQVKAAEMVRIIQVSHGPYWTRRAQLLVASSMGSQSASLDILVQAAENAWHGGNPDDALAAYDRARATARQQGELTRAFELGRTAAAIEQKRARYAEAMARYREVALDMPSQPKAAEAHMVAIYCAAQLARSDPAQLERLGPLLAEHISAWPQSSTADEARWQLGRLRQQEGDWPAAIAAFRAVSPAYAGYEKVIAAAEQAWLALIEARQAAGEPTEAVVREAAEWFESLASSSATDDAAVSASIRRRAALASARIRLNDLPAGYAAAERVLSSALSNAADAPPDWVGAARAIRVYALAGQGRQADASSALEEIAGAGVQPLLELITGLRRATREAAAGSRTELAELALRAIELVGPQRAQLTPSQRQAVERARAESLADAGRRQEASDEYGKLAARYPRDGAIQEGYARFLQVATDRPSLEAALAQWRQIEKQSPTGTDRWFRAKYEMASLHYRLGNKPQTAAIIRQLQVLQPDLGGEELRGRFLELLSKATQ